MLANGTGGFVIVNTNDLLGGMEKIAASRISITSSATHRRNPPRGAATVEGKGRQGRRECTLAQWVLQRAPGGCAGGQAGGKRARSPRVGVSAGKLGAPLQLPFFYASPNVARVNVAMEIPSQGFKFDKVKGKLHAEMNILGIAYRADNTVAAKFSDTLKFDYENKVEVEEFAKKPVHTKASSISPAGNTTSKWFSARAARTSERSRSRSSSNRTTASNSRSAAWLSGNCTKWHTMRAWTQS